MIPVTLSLGSILLGVVIAHIVMILINMLGNDDRDEDSIRKEEE